MSYKLNQRDLNFIIETLLPDRAEPEHVAARLQGDRRQLETMLDDERIFRRLMAEEDILLTISPWLFFTILLRRAWRDLEKEAFTVEQRSRQKIVLFDADRVVRLLAQEPVRDYLAGMLASFIRVETVTVLVQTQKGRWRGYRTNEFDIEGMIRYSQTLDEPFRFKPYQRIADVCLFLTGLFPEFINGRARYPLSGRLRPGVRGRLCQTMEDYERYGESFYRLAAAHEQAGREGLAQVLNTLSENFILAEKPLAYLATRYLPFARYTLFDL